jgi:hypothetical protein
MIVPIEARIFSFFVLYVLVAGLLTQVIFLPLTDWHAGDGLLIGGDWLLFHEVALNHAAKIYELGWSVAQLRPEGHGPSRLAAFFYAITGVSTPWFLLPIHAVVFAFAAVGLFWVVQGLSGSDRLGLLALVPMCMMPSMAMVWGQLHKDVWAIAAVLLIVGFWLRLLIGRSLPILMSLLVLAFANLSLWWMRPYTLQIILCGQVLLLFFLVFISVKFKRLLTIALGLFALLGTFTLLESTKVKTESTKVKTESTTVKSVEPYLQCKEWSFSLSSAHLDNTLRSIACSRDRLMQYSPNAKSNIDADISFSSAKDLLVYIPRAAQVGVLAPFPNMWFAEVASNVSRFFRLIAAAETITMYAPLLGIGLALVLIASGQISIGLERTVAMLALLGFSIVWVGIYALATGNVGSLYRMRFPIMLFWMGLGLWSWSLILLWWRNKNKAFNETSF